MLYGWKIAIPVQHEKNNFSVEHAGLGDGVPVIGWRTPTAIKSGATFRGCIAWSKRGPPPFKEGQGEEGARPGRAVNRGPAEARVTNEVGRALP
jgi:hypothetical protein